MRRTFISLSVAVVLMIGCSTNQQEQTSSEEHQAKIISEEATDNKTSGNTQNEKIMYPKLTKYIETVLAGMATIPQERKDKLEKLTGFVGNKQQSGETANLIFICTHNSRRSHLSQIWAATAAAHYGIAESVNTYSGGTEATAFNPRAVAAIKRAGLQVENPGGENPRYKVTYSDDGKVMECFSKKYDHPENASENFAAVMTCSEADKNCPFIPGASLRIPIPYVDPKESDGTDQEAATYDERCRQIATEMFYLMSNVDVRF